MDKNFQNKFDIIFKNDRVYVDYHFCREWENDKGCYGTNSNHGFTWDEVRWRMSRYYQSLADEWKDKKEEDYFFEWNNMEEKDFLVNIGD